MIAAAKPAEKCADVSVAPLVVNTVTSSAMPNMPPRKRPILKTPEALPISVAATEPRMAFWAAGIAIDTPTPARTSGTTSAA